MAAFDDKRQEEALSALKLGEEEELARVLAEKYGVGYTDLTRVSINTEALRVISEEEAHRGLMAAFDKLDRKLSIAVKSPVNDATKQVLAVLTERGFTTELFMVSMQSLERAWSRYVDLSSSTETRAGMLEISSETIQRSLEALHSLADIRTLLTETMRADMSHRISSILEYILSGALGLRASDIHIEPEENHVRLRYRLDGVLIDVLDFDTATYNLLLSRIKLVAGLKINIKNQAQEGRFSVTVAEADIEVRASVLPGAYGESIVLRILDPKTIQLSMEALGIDRKLFQILEQEIKRPNGMLLNTGPTGSGKTTTLYAFLRRIHNPDIKIITIEDPIEYHLPGIVQTQIDQENYTFEGGLRSALRQDPDIIMIGEIRDREVAETAINAALTGHLVFSTLHTNTAAGAFPRLTDMGVNPRVMSSAITMVMAQRLVRRLKPEESQEVSLSGAQKEIVEGILDSIVDTTLLPENRSLVWEPKTTTDEVLAFSGRVGVFEAIKMDKAVSDAVENSSNEREIAEAAKPQGLLTLPQDGILKALRGETSLSELTRVLDIPGLTTR